MRGARRVVAGMVAAMAMTGLVGCSRSGDGQSAAPSGARPPADVSLQAMIQCFRQHGLPDYPDAQFDPNDGRWHLPDQRPDLPPAVEQACASVLPQVTEGPRVPNGEFQQLVRFATCMRQHGFPDWPDPGVDGVFALPGRILDSSGSLLKSKTAVCAKDLPGGRFPQVRHA